MLWRRKWIVLVVVVAITGAAYFMSVRQPKQYEASTDLIYEKQLDIANPLTGQAYTDPTERTLELNSVGSVLASPDMQRRAREVLAREGATSNGFTVTAQAVTDTGAAASTVSSNVVRITATSENPKLAAVAADAYAGAFVAWRTERVKTQIEGAVEATKTELAGYHGAGKKSTDYLVLQQRLQDLKILWATASGNFRVLVPATVPESPVAPKPLRNALLGFFVGVLAGIGLAFLAEQFDRRVRTDADIAEFLQQPILARIPRISRRLLDQSALVTLTEPDGASAEAFRMLRTNLAFVNVDGDLRSIVLTSCLQGEGKSVTIANLAVTLAQGGSKVIVVDADLRRPRMHKYFGIENQFGVSTVVTGQSQLMESLQAVSVAWSAGRQRRRRPRRNGGLERDVPPLRASQRAADTEPRRDRLVQGFRRRHRSAGPGSRHRPGGLPGACLSVGDTPALAGEVDGMLFLVEPDVVSKQALARAREQLDRLPCKLLGVIVARRKGGKSYYTSRYYYRDDGNGGHVRRSRSKTGSAAPGA